MLENLTKVFSVVCLLFFCSNSNANLKEWNKTNKQLYGTYMTLQVLDTMQTLDMIDCQKNNPSCYLQEKNRFLNSRPSSTDLILMKGLLNYGVYHTLNNNKVKPHYKTIVLSLLIITSLNTVSNNYSNNVSFSIKF